MTTHACTYFVKDAKLLKNGLLRVRIAGSDDHSLWDGFVDFEPGSPDYDFYLWLQKKLRRRWFGRAGIDEETIAKHRSEYDRAA